MKKGQVSRDALILGGYLILLFATVPFMPRLWQAGVARFGEWHQLIPEGFATLLILLTLNTMLRQRAPRPLLRAGLLILLILFFFNVMGRLRLPVEKIHFSEYGLLSLLLFRLLRHWDSSRRVYLWTLTGACLIGVIDELFQGLLPTRVYDPRDLWLNGVGGLLGLSAVIILFDPFFLK